MADAPRPGIERDELAGELARICAHLARAAARRSGDAAAVAQAEAAVQTAGEASGRRGRVGEVAARLGLTAFETDALLLAAGACLSAEIPRLCALVSADARAPYPTFAVALTALPGADWRALAPTAPLRRLKLLDLAAPERLTVSELLIDERILHALLGTSTPDARLAPFLQPVQDTPSLPASLNAAKTSIVACWKQPADIEGLPPVVLQRSHASGAGDGKAIAASACVELSLKPYAMSAYEVPATPAEQHGLAGLWEREVRLEHAALIIDIPDDATPEQIHNACRLVEKLSGPVLVGSRGPLSIDRPCLNVEVQRLPKPEQRALWCGALGPLAKRLNGQIEALSQQFDLSLSDIGRVATRIRTHGDAASAYDVWNECRSLARRRLDELAQRIVSNVGWADLVLPNEQREVLHAIVAQVRHRTKVYEGWGFAARANRGLGISALFCGVSGTGKTMSAEIIANDLGLDLFRIDLAGTVSKYIGETERNLRRIFDAAEDSGAILLFDEADALFGKRSEVHDAHDRYANIEVSYLLQRMESYSGLAILTTNKRSALDEAFLRRIRFVVQFPFPDNALRREIWSRVFPEKALTKDIDLDKLARLNVPAGNIRNIALNAAFLAAEDGDLIGMRHLRRAAIAECAKLDKALTPSEIGGWT